jgi:hypothetical protein
LRQCLKAEAGLSLPSDGLRVCTGMPHHNQQLVHLFFVVVVTGS